MLRSVATRKHSQQPCAAASLALHAVVPDEDIDHAISTSVPIYLGQGGEVAVGVDPLACHHAQEHEDVHGGEVCDGAEYPARLLSLLGSVHRPDSALASGCHVALAHGRLIAAGADQDNYILVAVGCAHLLLEHGFDLPLGTIQWGLLQLLLTLGRVTWQRGHGAAADDGNEPVLGQVGRADPDANRQAFPLRVCLQGADLALAVSFDHGVLDQGVAGHDVKLGHLYAFRLQLLHRHQREGRHDAAVLAERTRSDQPLAGDDLVLEHGNCTRNLVVQAQLDGWRLHGGGVIKKGVGGDQLHGRLQQQ